MEKKIRRFIIWDDQKEKFFCELCNEEFDLDKECSDHILDNHYHQITSSQILV